MDWQGGDMNNAWRYAYMGLVRQSPAHQDAPAIAASIASWNRHVAVLERQLEQVRRLRHGAETFTLADIVHGPVGQPLVR